MRTSIAAVFLFVLAPATALAAAGAPGLAVFEENLGQAPSAAAFVFRGPASTAFLLEDGVAWRLEDGEGSAPIVRMQFQGGARTQPQGKTPLSSVTHYFTGAAEADWLRGVPHYACLRAPAVYPGVDAVYRIQEGRLRFDLELAPGACPSAVLLAFDGAGSLAIEDDGSLAIAAGASVLRLGAPLVFQENGAGGAKAVSGSFRLLDDRTAGFVLGAYNAAKPLVIDPLVYGTYAGGSNDDWAAAAALDQDGSLYIAGQTASLNFPAGRTFRGNAGISRPDGMLVKLTPSGALDFAAVIGGTAEDACYGLALGENGTIYLCGMNQSSGFPTTLGAFDTSHNGGPDAFVAALSAGGANLLFSTYLGGSGEDEAMRLAVGTDGSVFAAGWTESGDFPATAGAFQTVRGGSFDGFVARLRSTGSSLVYAAYLGGSETDECHAIAVDDANAAYVTGRTLSADFPTTAGAFEDTPPQGANAFAAKLNAAGTDLRYGTYLGGRGDDEGWAIAVNDSGRAFVAGATDSRDFPISLGADGLFGGGTDAFLTRLSPTGARAEYSTYYGGAGDEWPYSLRLAADQFVVMAGLTESINLSTTSPGISGSRSGLSDGFVAAYSGIAKTGTVAAFALSTYVGGSGRDQAFDALIDPYANLYVAGETASSNFPTTAGAADTTWNGGNDAFVLKYGGLFPGADTRTLTIAPSTNGATNPPAGTYEVLTGSTVTIEADADAGYRVGTWTGITPAPSAGSTEAEVTLDADRTVSVAFIEAGNGGGMGCPTGAKSTGPPLAAQTGDLILLAAAAVWFSTARRKKHRGRG